jgi:EamA domain-containing membrane protein RarD
MAEEKTVSYAIINTMAFLMFTTPILVFMLAQRVYGYHSMKCPMLSFFTFFLIGFAMLVYIFLNESPDKVEKEE